MTYDCDHHPFWLRRGLARLAMAMVCVTVAAAIPGQAGAAPFSTIACGDSDGLIRALHEANRGQGRGVIRLADRCIYSLTGVDNQTGGPTGLPVIVGTVTIEGNNATIRRGVALPSFRLFSVAQTGSLTLRRLTIADGRTSIGNCETGTATRVDGGGLYNAGSLVLIESVVTNNRTDNGCVGNGPFIPGHGGGVFNAPGAQATFIKSAITTNRTGHGGITSAIEVAGGQGGGLFNAGSAELFDSTIRDNETGDGGGGGAGGDGGGIYSRGQIVIAGSTVSANLTGSGRPTGHGAGVYNAGRMNVIDSQLTDNAVKIGPAGRGSGIYNSGNLRVIKTIIAGNSFMDQFSTDHQGGGIYSTGIIELIASTVSRNSGGNGAGVFNAGRSTIQSSTIDSNRASDDVGGIYNAEGAQMALANSTVSDNMAADVAGGIQNNGALDLINVTIATNQAGGLVHTNGTVTFKNTLLAGNLDQAGNPGPDCAGNALTSRGHNLIQNVTNCSLAGDLTDNVIGRDALLGPLADNGGPTKTRLPAPRSPAVDAGDRLACTGPPVNGRDQRGVRRPPGRSCDIGAVELRPRDKGSSVSD